MAKKVAKKPVKKSAKKSVKKAVTKLKPVQEKPAKPSPEEIDAEVALLKKMKPDVRKTSGFGDNHHDAIDAQIDVLENHLTNDSLFDKYGDSDSSDGDAEPGGNPDFQQNMLDEALHALGWTEGDCDEPPSESWKELLVK